MRRYNQVKTGPALLAGSSNSRFALVLGLGKRHINDPILIRVAERDGAVGVTHRRGKLYLNAIARSIGIEAAGGVSLDSGSGSIRRC